MLVSRLLSPPGLSFHYYSKYVADLSQSLLPFSEGAFLFERANYMEHPFHVCFGGCCVDLDFAAETRLRSHELRIAPSDGPGHLLARFADNVENIIGPQESMYKNLTACRRIKRVLCLTRLSELGPRGQEKKPGNKMVERQLQLVWCRRKCEADQSKWSACSTSYSQHCRHFKQRREGKAPFPQRPGEQPGKASPNQSDKSKQIDPARRMTRRMTLLTCYSTRLCIHYRQGRTAAKASPPRGHDYFEDVTVPIFDA